MSDPAFPPDGAVVRLNTHTRRVRSRPGDDGRVLVGGAPIRVSRISSAAAERLADRDLPVRDATSRALARYLLTTGMGELVASSLPAVPLSLLTVVVPVRDRPAQLARLLATVPAGVAEIVVVDDGSVHPDVVAGVATEHGARLLALPVNRGPGAARNAGLTETQTPYVAFVDSDVVLDERALDTLLRHMADPEVALVAPGVRGLRRERESWLERYEDARSSLDLGPDASTVRPRSRVSWVSSTCLVGRVAALGDGFDARLRVGEDVDLVWRLVAAGHRVTYDPSALVRHEHRATLGAWMRRKFDYGTGAYGLGVRHPRDIAPVALPPWSIGLLAVTLAQRRWSIPVGIGIVAAFAARTAGKISHIPRRRRLAALLAAQGTVTTLVQGTALLVRHWWPLTLVLALGSRRIRRAAVVAALADATIEYVRLRPRLDPVRFTVARRLDDLAYGAGVWWSALRGRSTAALRPRVVRGGERSS
jgi:mycofactocin system glycosyltransferase